MGVSKTLERAHLASRFEHRARAVAARAHDDGLRDADSARPGDEAPPEVVEPEALEIRFGDGALEAPLMSTRRVFVLGFTKTKPFFFNREGECGAFPWLTSSGQ